MPSRKGLLTPQNNFLDTIAKRFDGTREQTPETEMQTIQNALETYTESKTEIILYKNDGTFFWGLVDTIPIKNERGEVVLFLVSCKDITKEKLSSENDFGGAKQRTRRGSLLKVRRRSRQILYNISSHLSKPKITLNSKSDPSAIPTGVGNNVKIQKISKTTPEYKVDEASKPQCVILHYGVFKIMWDWLILLCTFYVAIMVPYNAAFLTNYIQQEGSENPSKKSSLVPDVIVEVLFIIDMVLNFRTTFVNKSGKVVYDGKTIALNYLKTWFLLDLGAVVPFDLLYAFNVKTSNVIPLLKISRLLRLARLLQKVDRYSQYSGVVLTLMMSMFALCAHWLACIWFAIGRTEAITSAENNWKAGWLYILAQDLYSPVNRSSLSDGTYEFLEQPNTMSYYITALYYTTSSLTSVGFGNVSANTNTEKIFAVITMLIGALMHAVIFGNVTAIIQRLYARRASYHSKTRDLKDFWRTYHIPKSLKTRMQEFFQTMWSLNNGIDIKDITKDFPEELRCDIAMHLHKEILSTSIFSNASKGCLKMISLQIKTSFCSPAETLIHEGDALSYVYYICSGSIEILKDGQVVAIMGKGDLFGHDVSEEELDDVTCAVKCSYEVRGMTYSDMQCLSIQGMKEVAQHYPEYAAEFSDRIGQELTFNLKEEIPPDAMPSIAECDNTPFQTYDEELSESETALIQTTPTTTGTVDKESVTNSKSFPTMSSPKHKPRSSESILGHSGSTINVGRRTHASESSTTRKSFRGGSRKQGSMGLFKQTVNESFVGMRQEIGILRHSMYTVDEKVAVLQRSMNNIAQGMQALTQTVNELATSIQTNNGHNATPAIPHSYHTQKSTDEVCSYHPEAGALAQSTKLPGGENSQICEERFANSSGDDKALSVPSSDDNIHRNTLIEADRVFKPEPVPSHCEVTVQCESYPSSEGDLSAISLTPPLRQPEGQVPNGKLSTSDSPCSSTVIELDNILPQPSPAGHRKTNPSHV